MFLFTILTGVFAFAIIAPIQAAFGVSGVWVLAIISISYLLYAEMLDERR